MPDEKRDVDGPGVRPDVYEREVTTDLKDETPDRPKGLPLHTRILIGLAAGAIAGLVVNALKLDITKLFVGLRWQGQFLFKIGSVADVVEAVGAVFLRLLLMVVVPLVFSSLVVGVAGIGDIRRLGRVGLKAFAYTFVISAISVVIGLTLARTIQPGRQLSAEARAGLESKYKSEAERRVADAEKGKSTDSALMQVVKTLIPSNPAASVAGVRPGATTQGDTPDMLHLMFFAVLIGVAATLVPIDVSAPLLRGLQALFEISAKIIDIIMKIAPYAVACLIFNNTARFGLDLLQTLGWFMATVLLGLGLHMFGVYSLSVYFLSRINPLEFFRRIKTVMLTAFSTSSSNATLPTALRVSEENLGVPREINTFVLTIGATANQNGTALYEGVTVLFLAQLAGVDLTLGQQLGIAYFAILGGIGTAGVPSGSIPFIILMLATYNIPTALIAIILGVDRILDMCRTTLNVAGDLTAATFVARSEGFELLQPHVPELARRGVVAAGPTSDAAVD